MEYTFRTSFLSLSTYCRDIIHYPRLVACVYDGNYVGVFGNVFHNSLGSDLPKARGLYYLKF